MNPHDTSEKRKKKNNGIVKLNEKDGGGVIVPNDVFFLTEKKLKEGALTKSCKGQKTKKERGLYSQAMTCLIHDEG